MSKTVAGKPFKTAFQSHPRYQIVFEEPTQTKQCFRDECDINNILRKYQKVGIVEHLARFQGRYGDFVTSEDYQSSLNKISEARACFDALPSTIRDRFHNDPAQFLDFAQNPKNVDEMVKLGLAIPRRSQDDKKIVESGSDS